MFLASGLASHNSPPMLPIIAVSLCLLSAAAFSPSGEGPCYFIDGSRDVDSSACYLLDSVGASMCCKSTDECRLDGLCNGLPNGPVGQYDDDQAIWRRSCTDFTWQNGACMAIGPCKTPGSHSLHHSTTIHHEYAC